MKRPRCSVHLSVKMERQPPCVGRRMYGKPKPENVLRYRCPVARCSQVIVVEKVRNA
jgi:hypothetical protein